MSVLELSAFTKAMLRWHKQEVRRLIALRNTPTAPPDLERQIFSAREEQDDFVNRLREKTGATEEQIRVETNRLDAPSA